MSFCIRRACGGCEVARHSRAAQEPVPEKLLSTQLPSASPAFHDWEARLAAYKQANPGVCIVDTPQAAQQARRSRGGPSPLA